MSDVECSVCATRIEDHLTSPGSPYAKKYRECNFCWGPMLIKTECVPIPNELLWEDSYSDPSQVRSLYVG